MPLDQAVRGRLARWAESATGIGDALMGRPGADWAAARTTYDDAMAALFPAPQGVTIGETMLGGVAASRIVPEAIEGRRTLLYIHGGGYASGAPRGYHGLAGRLALMLRAETFVPDYRLAPEHRFPVPIDDVVGAYRSLIESGCDPRSLILAGDSAGGAMVVTVMRKVRDSGLPLPAAGFAMSPWANLAHTGDTLRTRAGLDPCCSLESLTLLARNFLGDTLSTDPDVSPVHADVRGLPPILIQIGENEVMLSDAIRLAVHLGEQRVRVSLEVWPAMFHVWHLFNGSLSEADQALRSAKGFIDAVLGQA